MILSNGGFICSWTLAADPAQPPFREVQCMLQLCYQHNCRDEQLLKFLGFSYVLTHETRCFTHLLVRHGREVEELNRTSDL